ncbi:MAG TPA: glycosyltransferase family 1 protein [Cyanobacteria bacterium UBA8803]|nr:glycosyltransferase family 1 protein [Cyanobacteria bacterium UBA9273]HBL60236.1 glycosyltransferase family 1 protein [Cyanobacteria bacterium UBA8803]
MDIIVLEKNPSRIGGKELSVLDVCRGLSQRGHVIHLIYVEEGDLLEQYQEFCQSIVKAQSFTIERNKTITGILNLLYDIFKNYHIRADVIYINQYQDCLFAYGLALAKNIPLVCHLRNPPPFYLYLRWSLAIKRVNKFIAVSHQTKSDWVNYGFSEEKIEVVHNGIEPEVFTPCVDLPWLRQKMGINEKNRVIFYAGRLDKTKGLETLIKGFSLVINSGIDAKLLIAGKPFIQNYDYQESLKKFAVELEVDSSIEFLGHLDNPVPLYQVSDVTVLPSLDSEPFGRTIIESMACGIPALASRTGGIPEILTGVFQAWLFEPGNAQDLSEKLIKIIDWRDRDAELAQRCREHVIGKFALEKVIDGVEKALMKIIK